MLTISNNLSYDRSLRRERKKSNGKKRHRPGKDIAPSPNKKENRKRKVRKQLEFENELVLIGVDYSKI